jgi:hypothetical protein
LFEFELVGVYDYCCLRGSVCFFFFFFFLFHFPSQLGVQSCCSALWVCVCVRSCWRYRPVIINALKLCWWPNRVLMLLCFQSKFLAVCEEES